MCDPISLGIASVVVSAGSAVASYEGQKKASKANKKAAQAAGDVDMKQLAIRQQQETAGAAQSVAQGDRQARQATAMDELSAAEAHIAGQSAQAVLDDVQRQDAAYKDSVGTNLANINQQIDMERQGVKAGVASRIAAVPAPSFLGTALQIGGAGLDAYGGYLRSRPVVASQPQATQSPLAGFTPTIGVTPSAPYSPPKLGPINLPTNR